MPSTPSSGAISINDIRTAFPSINSGSLNAYRGQPWYVAGTGSSGTFSSGQLALGDFYNKTGTQQIPIIPYQNIAVYPWGYHMGGCYGTGVNNLYIQIGSYYGISMTATGWAADYTVVSPGYNGNWSPNGNVPGGSFVTNASFTGASGFINTSTGFPYSSYTSSGINTFSAGRDTNSILIQTSWDGATFTLTVRYDCKGGGLGYSTYLYQAAVPFNWVNGPY